MLVALVTAPSQEMNSEAVTNYWLYGKTLPLKYDKSEKSEITCLAQESNVGRDEKKAKSGSSVFLCHTPFG